MEREQSLLVLTIPLVAFIGMLMVAQAPRPHAVADEKQPLVERVKVLERTVAKQQSQLENGMYRMGELEASVREECAEREEEDAAIKKRLDSIKTRLDKISPEKTEKEYHNR